jgi:hypothetical protein
MNIMLWILQVLVAFLFLMTGSAKAFRPLDDLAQRWDWIAKAPPQFVRLLGFCEMAGAVGLILPAVTSVLPQCIVAAAIGLAMVAASATLFHLSRREFPPSIFTTVILLATVVIVVGRWPMAMF